MVKLQKSESQKSKSSACAFENRKLITQDSVSCMVRSWVTIPMSGHRFALENEIAAASRMDSTVNISSGSNRGNNNGGSVVWSNKENHNGRGGGANKSSAGGGKNNSSLNGSSKFGRSIYPDHMPWLGFEFHSKFQGVSVPFPLARGRRRPPSKSAGPPRLRSPRPAGLSPPPGMSLNDDCCLSLVKPYTYSKTRY